jgi:methionyl-tRNA formyltransferase
MEETSGGRGVKIVFWGTPDFAVPSLRALDEEGHDLVAVVTQPDRPAGRGRQLRPSAVKEVAMEAGIRVLTPMTPQGDEFMAELHKLQPDLSVVVAYGRILRQEVIDLPRLGTVNVHASLLPALRGAAPINWAIARGHDVSGVCIMRLVEALDAGPVILSVEEPIGPTETASELTARLAEVGAAALVEALTLLEAGVSEEVEQDDAISTYAPKVSREVARIDWSRSASEISNHVRGMDAVPGAWTLLDGQPLKLFRPHVLDHGPAATAGAVVMADATEGLVVAAARGWLRFGEVQPPGKRRMESASWIAGRGVSQGQLFE